MGALPRVLGQQAARRTARVLLSDSTDAYTNLAIEDWLFRSVEVAPDAPPVLYLYRNAPSIVLGRNQNPWKQCRMGGLRDAGVSLVRRSSGGGTVYHDLGNTNFCFIGHKSLLGDKPGRYQHAAVMAGALQQRFGLPVRVSEERVDLVASDDGPAAIRGAKFSGAAFRVSGERAYYHGTMLLNADLSALTHLLYIDEPTADANVFITGKDTASVRAPYGVVNLVDLPRAPVQGQQAETLLDHDSVVAAVGEHWSASLGLPLEIITLCHDDILSMPVSEAGKYAAGPMAQKLASYEWTFGGSPAFQARIHCSGNSDLPDTSGRKLLEIDVKRGMVHNVDVIHSCGTVTTGSLAAAITEVLRGQQFRSQAFLAAADESARSGLADSDAVADALRIAAHHLQEVE